MCPQVKTGLKLVFVRFWASSSKFRRSASRNCKPVKVLFVNMCLQMNNCVIAQSSHTACVAPKHKLWPCLYSLDLKLSASAAQSNVPSEGKGFSCWKEQPIFAGSSGLQGLRKAFNSTSENWKVHRPISNDSVPCPVRGNRPGGVVSIRPE